jgi:DNA-binding transcriptional regulator YdaS (Cro superfamily)
LSFAKNSGIIYQNNKPLSNKFFGAAMKPIEQMTLSEYLRSLNPNDRQAFADGIPVHLNYLYQVAGGHRKASIKLAWLIDITSGGVVKRWSLRPDYWDTDGVEIMAKVQQGLVF